MPACAYSDANAPATTWACEADISWCGNTRSLPPPWTSNGTPRYSMAMAAHSTCQPGRPGPNGLSHDGSPGRAFSHTSGSSGSFLPGRSGSPPRSANRSRIAGSGSRDTEPNAGSVRTEK